MADRLETMRSCQLPFSHKRNCIACASCGESYQHQGGWYSANEASPQNSHSYSVLAADGLPVPRAGGALLGFGHRPSIHRAKRITLVSRLPFVLLLSCFLFTGFSRVNSACLPAKGCTALAHYVVPPAYNASFISLNFFGGVQVDDIKNYNTDIADISSLTVGQEIRIPFQCDCHDGTLSQYFFYKVETGDTVLTIAETKERYQNLTKVEWIEEATPLPSKDQLVPGQKLTVPINCSCGTATKKTYRLFLTYPAQLQDTEDSLASKFGILKSDLDLYNPGTNWSSIEENKILFIPAKDGSGNFPKYNGKTIQSLTSGLASSDSGNSNTGLVIGAVIGGAGLVLLCSVLVVFCLCCWPYSRGASKAHEDLELHPSFDGSDVRMMSGSTSKTVSNPSIRLSGALSRELPPDFNDYKSVEFSYEELAAATNNFNDANKIGEGGYGAVYLANLRGQKLAVKRMNLQATREFMAELQVLTHVHHTNLVQLVGYCTVESLFLIYEFVENGTLAEHLRRSKKGAGALTWAQRVQIALDAARGLEYIHEHTKPTYIHRDVKSTNILIDKHYHAKVADFGLTKLTESSAGSISLTLPTRLVGTFGYMSPEYARFGDVSPMVDVYSFGVVLLEILSAKEAIVREDGPSSNSSGSKEQRGLVTLFESVLKDADGRALLKKVMDPALENNYPPESAWKMAQLAGMCTKEIPELRPTMRVVVVALMTLASSTQSWEVGSAFSNDYFLRGSRDSR